MRKLVFAFVAMVTLAAGISFLRRYGFITVIKSRPEDIEDLIENIRELYKNLRG